AGRQTWEFCLSMRGSVVVRGCFGRACGSVVSALVVVAEEELRLIGQLQRGRVVVQPISDLLEPGFKRDRCAGLLTAKLLQVTLGGAPQGEQDRAWRDRGRAEELVSDGGIEIVDRLALQCLEHSEQASAMVGDWTVRVQLGRALHSAIG